MLLEYYKLHKESLNITKYVATLNFPCNNEDKAVFKEAPSMKSILLETI